MQLTFFPSSLSWPSRISHFCVQEREYFPGVNSFFWITAKFAWSVDTGWDCPGVLKQLRLYSWENFSSPIWAPFAHPAFCYCSPPQTKFPRPTSNAINFRKTPPTFLFSPAGWVGLFVAQRSLVFIPFISYLPLILCSSHPSYWIANSFRELSDFLTLLRLMTRKENSIKKKTVFLTSSFLIIVFPTPALRQKRA